MMATYTGIGVDDQGNTINFTLSAVIAPATIYVAATGSDTNNGRTPATAYKTIDKINSLVLARGGQVLFNGGDTFIGNLTPNIDGAGDPNNPLTIGSYGTGRATINPASGGFGTGIINIDTMSGVTVQDVILSAPDLTKQPRAAIRLASGGKAGDWLIQRVDASGIRFNSTIPNGDWGALIMFEGVPGKTTVKNCDLHGEAGVNSLTDAGVAGFGGSHIAPGLVTFLGVHVWNIGSAGTASKNVPAGSAVGVVYPPLGNGISVDGAYGGVKGRHCLVHDCGGNYNNPGGGPFAFLTHNTTGADFQFCEGYNVQPLVAFQAADFGGVDFDNTTKNGLAQYCFMHDNYNSGYMHFDRAGGWDNNTFRKNLSINNCKQGQPGFYEICIDANGLQHTDDNIVYNDRVYAGQPYGNVQQGSGFISIKASNVSGTVKNNVGVLSPNIYGSWSPVNARYVKPPLAITDNQWFGRNGGGQDFWWGPTQYFDVASFQTACGGTGNSAILGSGPTIIKSTALNLTAAERVLCVSALNAVAGLPGMATGNDSFGVPLPGARASALAARLNTADSPVTLPEYIVLGFALTRIDTPASAALLARLEPIVLAA